MKAIKGVSMDYSLRVFLARLKYKYILSNLLSVLKLLVSLNGKVHSSKHSIDTRYCVSRISFTFLRLFNFFVRNNFQRLFSSSLYLFLCHFLLYLSFKLINRQFSQPKFQKNLPKVENIVCRPFSLNI